MQKRIGNEINGSYIDVWNVYNNRKINEINEHEDAHMSKDWKVNGINQQVHEGNEGIQEWGNK